MAMLTVENLNVYYGMIHALKDVSFEVNQGEIVALIGANGAGKTTTLHTVSGMLPAKSGSVKFEGKEIIKTPGHQFVSLGMSHVPEGRRVFAGLSVYENLKMGAYTRKDKKEIADTLEMVYTRFPRLKERTRQLAGTLSGGEQQMLAMGRALMAHPKIILMDEPSMGLSPQRRRCRLQTALMSLRPVRSSRKATRATCLTMNPSRRHTWASNPPCTEALTLLQ